VAAPSLHILLLPHDNICLPRRLYAEDHLDWLASCNDQAVTWLAYLGIAVFIVAIAAVTGIKPKGTRSVSHSRMMGIGRLALLVIVVILVYAAFRARAGG
jgi:choline-glycine betaine transporter